MKPTNDRMIMHQLTKAFVGNSVLAYFYPEKQHVDPYCISGWLLWEADNMGIPYRPSDKKYPLFDIYDSTGTPPWQPHWRFQLMKYRHKTYPQIYDHVTYDPLPDNHLPTLLGIDQDLDHYIEWRLSQ